MSSERSRGSQGLARDVAIVPATEEAHRAGRAFDRPSPFEQIRVSFGVGRLDMWVRGELINEALMVHTIPGEEDIWKDASVSMKFSFVQLSLTHHESHELIPKAGKHRKPPR